MIRTICSMKKRMGFLFCCQSGFCQAVGQKNKTMMRDRAIAAAQTIRFLCGLMPNMDQSENQNQKQGKNSFKDIINKPLSFYILDHLQNLTIKRDGRQGVLKPEIIEQFENMFDPTKGVILPQHFLGQQRIKLAMNAKNKSEDKTPKKFSFFPNRISTVEIFRILNSYNAKTLMYGSPGIAKTTSIVFYCHLTAMITEYEFEFDEIVAPDIEKIFYLSYTRYNRDQNDKKQHENQFADTLRNQIFTKIHSQCPQKLKSQISNAKNVFGIMEFSKNYRLIKHSLKQKKIQSKIVIDQFNNYVAQIRTYNAKIEQNTKPPQELVLMKSMLQDEKHYWINLSNLLTDNKILYNSSINIQSNILDKNIVQKHFNLNLNYHEPLNKKVLDFASKLRSLEGKKQMLRILFFEMKRCSKTQKQLSTVSQIERQIFSKQDSYFERIKNFGHTHYYMRLYFQKQSNSIYNIVDNYTKPQDCDQIINKIISGLEEHCLTAFRQDVMKFCNQVQNERVKSQKSLLLFILRQKIIAKLKAKDQNNPNKIKIENQVDNIHFLLQKQGELITQEQLRNKGLTFSLKQQNIDKLMFDYSVNQLFESKNWIRLKITDEYFLKITSFVDELIFQSMAKSSVALNFIFSMISATQSLIGQLFQSFVLFVLKNFNCFVSFNKPTGLDSLRFEITKRSQFIHFNAGIGKLSLEDRLNKLIQPAEKIMIGKPITDQGNDSPNSASFDFIILQKKQKSYQVYSIDFSVSEDKTYISKKIVKAQNLLRRIFEHYGNSLDSSNTQKIRTWNHFIISNYQESAKNFQCSINQSVKNSAKCEILTSSLKLFNIELKYQYNRTNQENKGRQLYQEIFNDLKKLACK